MSTATEAFQTRPKSTRTLRKHITSRMLTGLLTLIPFAATVLVLRFLFGLVDSLLAPVSGPMEKAGIPGAVVVALSVLIVCVILYIAGIIVTNSLGKRGLAIVEDAFMKLPLLKTVYGSIRSTVKTLSVTQGKSFSSVVLIEFPRKGAWGIGFVTGTSKNQKGEEYLRLFIPTTPNPTSGYFEIIPKRDVLQTGMTVEEGIRSVVSGGILFPDLVDLPHGRPETSCRPIEDPEEDPYDHVWE